MSGDIDSSVEKLAEMQAFLSKKFDKYAYRGDPELVQTAAAVASAFAVVSEKLDILSERKANRDEQIERAQKERAERDCPVKLM